MFAFTNENHSVRRAFAQQAKTVLMSGNGLLRPVYQLMLAQETGSWEQAKEFAEQLHIS